MILPSLLASNTFIDAYNQSDFFGKCIFLMLFALSVLSWTILTQKLLIDRKIRRNAKLFNEAFQKKKTNPLNIEWNQTSKEKGVNPFLEIYRLLKNQTVELLNKNKTEAQGNIYLSTADIELVGANLSSCVAIQVKNLERNLFILSTTYTLGPFLGLLGTVWGILTTFAELQSKTSGQSNDMMLGGLAMALGTTVIGLLVAIPALVGYNYLKNTVREFQSEMEDFSTVMLTTVEVQYRKVEL
ncbi:MAG: MotA/TolQ/ExbB proton channel family protein [Parachlamydiales bacterium]|nr:MotA/TolQ/ExbB proton channel family protein [Parachlamydiales bacterium]